MNPAGRVAPISELASAIEAYTHSQRELLECVRRLRAEIHRAVLDNGGLDSPGVPPSPDDWPPPTVEVAAALPFTEALAPGGVGAAARSSSERRSSRNYDYFAELDAKLARLEAQLSEEPLRPSDEA